MFYGKGWSSMTPEQKSREIFEASIGCTAAAVEFLRSVNKPLNVTYIAQTAWEIAKKLEEFQEQTLARELKIAAGEAVVDNKPVSSMGYSPVKAAPTPGAPGAPKSGELKEEDLVAFK